jgi:serine/threonine protein kinase
MMPVPEYMALLKKTGLLSPAQWTIAEEAAHRHSDSAQLSAELVRLGLLTSWQSLQLLKGQTGFVLHHYRLLEAIGRGGMGHVFKAQDSRTSAIVAIKVMSRKLSSNQNLVNRFRREIRASSRLSSPNIVRTLDAGRVGRIDFMVMEFVNGDQLDGILSRLPLIPPATACEIVRQAALGLQHAHECRMVHRDIKPGNLMIDWDAEGRGVIKIMDMGLVRLDEEKEELTAVTRAGQVMGTPDYMSPEQGWNTAKVDIRSDIYSLGCTFYRMLTARMPFPGDNPLQVLMARCSKDAPAPKLLRPDLPDAIDAIVRKMTLRDPEARYQSPAELAAALEPHCAPLTIEALRECARAQGADEEAIVLDAASRVDLSDPQDAGYQQFLREMDTGASVDLMMSNTPSGGFALTPTLPVIQERRTIPPDRRSGDAISRTSQRRRRTALFTLSGAALIVVVIAAFVLLRKDSNPTPAKQSSGDVAAKPAAERIAPPTASLEISPPLNHAPGDLLQYDPVFAEAPPVLPKGSELIWKLVAGAPTGASIDARTGRVSWKIPDQCPDGAFPIPFLLIYQQDGSEQVIAQSQVVASVKASTSDFAFIPPKTIRLRPGQAVAQRIESVPLPPEQGAVRFRLSGGIPDGSSIDGGVGEFRWTPSDSQLGKHQLTVELYDQQAKKVVASTPLEIFVAPDSFEFPVPGISRQKATPGQTLRIPIYSDPPPRMLGKIFSLRLENRDLPAGVSLEENGNMLVWKVPADAKGSVTITLTPRILIPDFKPNPELSPVTVTIDVIAQTSPMPDSGNNMPDPELVKKAEEEVRERHRRELASSTRRAAHLRQLLETAIDQSPGHENLALLNVIISSDGGTKSADSILDAAILRKQRYNAPIPAELTELCSQLKPTSLNSVQGDRITEHCLTLAALAVAEERWDETGKYLRIPVEYSRKSGRATFPEQFTTDLAKALEAAETLKQGGATTTDSLKREIESVLSAWRFQPALRGPGGLRFVSSNVANAPTQPDNAPSPWSFEGDRIRLNGPQAPRVFGILDPALDAPRWILRTQVASSSSSCDFVVGTADNGNLVGHLLYLEPLKMGLVLKIPEQTVVSQANGNATWPASNGFHDLEIRVDEKDVRVRIDGVVVVNTTLPQAFKGAAGFMASMEKAGEKPVLELRRTRFLRLP